MILKASPFNASKFRRCASMSDRAEIVVEDKKLLASKRWALCKHDKFVFDIVQFLNKHNAAITKFEGARKKQHVIEVHFRYAYLGGRDDCIIVNYKTHSFVEVYFGCRTECSNRSYDKKIPFAEALEKLMLFDQIEEMMEYWNFK